MFQEKKMFNIGMFLGHPLWIEAPNKKRAELAEKVLNSLILGKDKDVEKEIEEMRAGLNSKKGFDLHISIPGDIKN